MNWWQPLSLIKPHIGSRVIIQDISGLAGNKIFFRVGDFGTIISIDGDLYKIMCDRTDHIGSFISKRFEVVP